MLQNKFNFHKDKNKLIKTDFLLLFYNNKFNVKYKLILFHKKINLINWN